MHIEGLADSWYLDYVEGQLDESFDIIIDFGTSDAMMGLEHGLERYILEVKRLLKVGGRYVCVTSGDSFGLRLKNLRFGWAIELYATDQNFIVVAKKYDSVIVSLIASPRNIVSGESLIAFASLQNNVSLAIQREKLSRMIYAESSGFFYPLGDLHRWANGKLEELKPGRRLKFKFSEPGLSHFTYKGILLDAGREFIMPFSQQFGVYITEKLRTREWISTEEGQWETLRKYNVARLLLIFLEPKHSVFFDGQIDQEVLLQKEILKKELLWKKLYQKEFSQLFKILAPRGWDSRRQDQFLTMTDRTEVSNSLYKVISSINGTVIVKDVMFLEMDDVYSHQFVRRVFGRFVLSEARLSIEGPIGGQNESSSDGSESSDATSGEMKVNHDYLESAHHIGIISGLMLISLHLSGSTYAVGGLVNTLVIGLKVGLLPMFMRNNLPSLVIKVVEKDETLLDLAKKYFGFAESESLKVHIADGKNFVDDLESISFPRTIDVIIIDGDYSPKSKSCVASLGVDIVGDSFLSKVQLLLSDRGVFIIHLASSLCGVKAQTYRLLKMKFTNVLSLELGDRENVDELIFCTKYSITEEELQNAGDALEKSSEFEKHAWFKKVLTNTKLIKPAI